MNLKEIYSNQPAISFEVFPEENTENLFSTLGKLKKYNPALVSLTYGAGGKNKAFSTDILLHLKEKLQLNLMPHFSCICNTLEAINKNLEIINTLGIENILALRGDIPNDKSLCCYDFKYANELISHIKSKTNLSIGAAGYPEGHIECADLKTDIDNLKQKVDSGADVIYTQLFFDTEKYYKFTDLAIKAGITVPIIPGIMPILSKKQVEKMTHLARITVPYCVQHAIESYTDKDIKQFGIDYATKQCTDLLDFGVRGLHFFTLNLSGPVSKILDNLIGEKYGKLH